MIIMKSNEEISLIGKAGKIVAECLKAIADNTKLGISTIELDSIAEEFILSRGGKPAFKGYRGYPASLCTSVNNVIVHGIPSDYKLKDGDIISLDLGVEFKGYIADSAITLPVGVVSDEASRLIQTTHDALYAGIDACKPGNRLSDISNAIQTLSESRGFSVVRELVGHGVGKRVHEDPQIPNYGPPHQGPILKEGMVLAIEPMVNAGSFHVLADDGWPVVTEDSRLSAHFEHTVAVNSRRPLILTLVN